MSNCNLDVAPNDIPYNSCYSTNIGLMETCCNTKIMTYNGTGPLNGCGVICLNSTITNNEESINIDISSCINNWYEQHNNTFSLVICLGNKVKSSASKKVNNRFLIFGILLLLLQINFFLNN